MLLTVLSQLGILVFFGTLAGVIAKAPWVYPYSWHPICMGLYGFLATEAILILQPIEKATQKRSVKILHGYIQSLAFLLSVAGFVAIYVNKDLRGKEHFTTNHAYYGSTAVFVFFLQVLFGTSVAYLPRRVFNWIGYARIVRIHRIVGYFSIALVWITLWLAALTNWMKRNFADHEWIFAIGIAMIAVGLVGQITPSRLFGTGRRTTSA
ncbi:MAG: eukaryotic cytochrome b561-domain-containing protein [Benniella sp.]|nr:MAG: eukaryotic cytochrome b561-domain-containing protein [Benniella sp.]